MSHILTTLEQEVETVIDGETFTKVEDVGVIIYVESASGKVHITPFIRMHYGPVSYRWLRPVVEFDIDNPTHLAKDDVENWGTE